ncbi:MAG: D-glycerate dehydrogenase [Planctomycetota bacterium]|nr:D-glycerate dehydrogenase [Planctomycetota bacterium]
MPPAKILLDIPLPDFLEATLAPHCEIHPWSLLDEPAGEMLDSIRGIYTYGHVPVTGALLDRLPRLLVVSNFGVGVDHVDVAACESRGIAVGNTPGAVDGVTADMTMALMLAAARNIVAGDHFARSPGFTSYNPSHLPGLEVHGSTLGIIGMGRIGREVARRARGFDMRILYHNRNRDLEAEQALGAEYSELATLLEQAHFVSLNVPLTEETEGLIGEQQLRMMREDAVLVNVARGPVVDPEALHAALSEGWIAGAALDVTEPEPLPRDHPLLGLDNLVLTPHLGSATRRSRLRMAEMARDNLVAGLEKSPLPNQVREPG